MAYTAPLSAYSPENVEASRLDLAPRILRLADGDAAFSAQIREVMWGEYCSVGAPLGYSEEGMWVWWDEQLGELAV